MRIAFLTLEFVTEYLDGGGIGNYLNRVSAALSRLGHEVEIFTRAERDGTSTHHGIPVHRVRSEVPQWLTRLFDLFPRRFRIPRTLATLRVAHRLRSVFLRRHKEAPFDVVQVPQFNAPGLFLSLNSPVPVVTRISNYEPAWRKAEGALPALDRRLSEWLELLAMRRSAGVYSPSRCLAQVIREHVGLSIDVIPPPMFIETEMTDESVYARNLANLRYLLFFGWITRLKGLYVLVEALRTVMPRCPDMHFVFVGQARWEAVQKILPPHAERIHYLSPLPHPQLYPIIRHSRGVVLPSLIDNLPNACLESMALGRPVIGTRGASFDELLVDGESGFLVEPGDHHGLADAMLRLWALPDSQLDRMGEMGKRSLGRYSPEVACAQLEQFMSGILASATQEPRAWRISNK
ncbi:MAG TPA: glycosyltransferase family 4 protein [Thermodesulfobacteriota bacterium]